MRYKEYMEIIKQKLNQMNDQQKYDWIYNYVRKQNKKNRQAIIDTFDNAQNVVTFDNNEFMQFIDQINSRKITIKSYDEEFYNQVKRSWHNEIVYVKDAAFVSELDKYINIAFQAVLNQQYSLALHIFNHFSELTIATDNEYGYFEEFDINDLFLKGFISQNIKSYYLNYLYAAFKLELEINDLFRIFKQYHEQSDVTINEIMFEDLLMFGHDEIKFDHYTVVQWIDFLENQPGDLASKLIIDACYNDGGIKRLQEVAAKIGAIHPRLYQEVCDYYLRHDEFESAKENAIIAFDKIPDSYLIRTIMAEKLLLFFDDSSLYEIIFLSNPNYENCFRLYQHTNDFNSIIIKFNQIDYTNNLFDGFNKECQIKNLSPDEKIVLQFMLGYQEKTMDLCIKGLVSNDVKKVLVLLLLNSLNENEIYQGDYQLTNCLRTCLGFQLEIRDDRFDKYIRKWKQKYQVASDKISEYLNWLKIEIYNDVITLINHQKRQEYQKVASEIVVLAKLLVEYHLIDHIDEYLDVYYREYNQDQAFIRELDNAFNLLKPNDENRD